MKEFYISLRKNNRKNSKSEFLTFTRFRDFNISDIFEVVALIENRKNIFNTKTKVFFRFLTFISSEKFSFEDNINDIYNVMNCLNDKKFDFTLNDLHNNSNIRFHINRYYNN